MTGFSGFLLAHLHPDVLKYHDDVISLLSCHIARHSGSGDSVNRDQYQTPADPAVCFCK